MTPKQRRDFESEWPELAKRLDSFLARRGVDQGRREDLVQETATRLFRCWPSVDRSVPVGALACTIAMNLLRDESRRKPMQLLAEMPEAPSGCDVERAGIARVELQKVATALRSMSPSQRAILLREVGEDVHLDFITTDAEKMQRMRARRKLNSLLERMAGVVSLRFLRFFDFVSALVPSKDGALGALTCAACLFVGMGGSVVVSSGAAQASSVERIAHRTAAPRTARPIAATLLDSRRSLDAAVAPGTGAPRAVKTGTVPKEKDSTKETAGQAGGTKSSPSVASAPGPSGSSGSSSAPQAPSTNGHVDTSIDADVPDGGAPQPPVNPSLPSSPNAPSAPSAPGAPALPSGPKPDESPPDAEEIIEVTEVVTGDLKT